MAWNWCSLSWGTVLLKSKMTILTRVSGMEAQGSRRLKVFFTERIKQIIGTQFCVFIVTNFFVIFLRKMHNEESNLLCKVLKWDWWNILFTSNMNYSKALPNLSEENFSVWFFFWIYKKLLTMLVTSPVKKFLLHCTKKIEAQELQRLSCTYLSISFGLL